MCRCDEGSYMQQVSVQVVSMWGSSQEWLIMWSQTSAGKVRVIFMMAIC